MSDELFLYGMIEGASYQKGEEYQLLQERNEEALAGLIRPEDDEWPWLNRSIFALPGPWPQGTFRRQILHFGGSIKDDSSDPLLQSLWIGKLELVLRQLYWRSARAILQPECMPARVFDWRPTKDAYALMMSDQPQPIRDWERRELSLPRLSS